MKTADWIASEYIYNHNTHTHTKIDKDKIKRTDYLLSKTSPIRIRQILMESGKMVGLFDHLGICHPDFIPLEEPTKRTFVQDYGQKSSYQTLRTHDKDIKNEMQLFFMQTKGDYPLSVNHNKYMNLMFLLIVLSNQS